jgi:PAS domain S-box-containing protein
VEASLPDPKIVRTPISIKQSQTSGSSTVAAEPAELFRLLVESIRDYAIFVLDPEGNVLTWNLGAQALKGYTREEIIGKNFSQFYPAEAVQSGWPQRELVLAQKEGRFADEGWRVRKDGTTFWASVIITPLRSEDGSLTGFAKVTQNLTERRQTEERFQKVNRELRQRVSELDESKRQIELRTLELQKLSAQLLYVQDEERRRIARELHDDLGQQLAGLKMAISRPTRNEQAIEMADTAISTVRSLSYLLHPPLLDEAGLKAALHWYAEGLGKRSDIEISVTLTPIIFPRLSKEIETTIFRIVQESLTNVYRHAKSESARVEIERQPEIVIVRVRDFGQGLPSEPNGRPIVKFGVGVSGMRERVRQFGGELSVSRAEPGTLVEAKIPLFTLGI